MDPPQLADGRLIDHGEKPFCADAPDYMAMKVAVQLQ
jgi:hypothetical protein